MELHHTTFVEQCANLCSNNNDCCAIEYSHSTTECQIHKECIPDNLQYKDYILYQKGMSYVTLLSYD